MDHSFIFDQSHYEALNAARETTLRSLLSSLSKSLELQTAVDVGCGLGYFSNLLAELGLTVRGLDGRSQNIAEAARRYPGIQYSVVDAEDQTIRSFGEFDVVLCFGLLYHLENPFAAIRNLFALTSKVAILEGICLPGDEPILEVRDEGPTEDQALRHVALYPSENGLVKLLYRSGFPHVYRFRTLPEHPDYERSSLREKMRTILVASTIPLSTDLLYPTPEPVTSPDTWTVRNSPSALILRGKSMMTRLGHFMTKPWPEKQRILQKRWTRMFPS